MEVVTTEIYKDAKELLCNTPTGGNKIEIENEEEVINALIENDIDVEDIEMQDDMVVIYGNPQDLFKIKDAITSSFKNIEFEIDEISKLPKEKVTLQGEDLETFKKVLTLLDDVEDVKQVYHNVEL